MSKSKITPGRRIDPAYCLPIEFTAGCYGVRNDADWSMWPPGASRPETCPADLVTIHHDGTATVDAAVNVDGWSGYLQRGVWCEGIDLGQEGRD